ncbi:MAG: ATP-binding cassette domain-containing protein [Anaerolineaceae bacterium]|nr:ATP-binding cassette domain-containing protein [Anaerolineaceae bacterium]
MLTWAIETDHLVKKFAKRNLDPPNGKPGLWPFRSKVSKTWSTAVDGVDMHIYPGEVFGLLGPNGAGKSTTIRMLCTLLEPTSGTAHVNGYDVVRQANLVRQNLGTVLAGERSIYWKLTGRENLEYFAALYHIPADVAKRRIKELLERMELNGKADELVEKYSTGMKQRIVISRALLARPPILLFDEPTLGLDPQAARKVRELVQELKAEGHTILLTTHYMEEADLLSDRIGIIDQGKIIALGTPAELKQQIQQKEVIHLEVSGWKPEMESLLRGIPSVENLATRHTGADSIYEVSLQSSNSRAVLPGIIERVNHNGTHLVNLKVDEPSLEDVFIQLTGKALRD